MNGPPSDLLDLISLGRYGSAAPKKNVHITQGRDLTPADVLAVAQAERSGTLVPATQSRLRTLRTIHHSIAQALADGRAKDWEVAAIFGYATHTISQLKSDPAFRELIAYYQSQKLPLYLDAHTKLAALGTSAVEAITELMEKHHASDDPRDKLPVRVLQEIAEFALDRSIAPAKGAGAAGGTGAPLTVHVSFVKAEDKPAVTIDGTVVAEDAA